MRAADGHSLGIMRSNVDKTAMLLAIKDECAWENIPRNKILALAETLALNDVDWLMSEINSIDLSTLEDDAGDIRA